MATETETFMVVIQDVNTGKIEEKQFTSLAKAEALAIAIDFANGKNKIVEIFDNKGKKLL